ncbi:ribonuclease H-like protein [Penicillium angulare]|uniref:ribonuclease H-like protein n=1 Tax=Penicillium angulare TaxID=116970 RepID=UPI00253F9B20|nr:ribonuclease H-like protein [Penicillium angulare]KAJ5287065.1 ribonuclease H-like protein [Penicillium angulare]
MPNEHNITGVRYPLEDRSPTKDHNLQTTHRAQLRAAIAACRFYKRAKGGFDTLVNAINSDYVFDGAISWIKFWVANGWFTKMRRPVSNQYLWACLLGETERKSEDYLKIPFWNK